MLINILKSLFRRDLEKLKQEISLYKDEKKLWVIEQGVANSAGNLCLHLIGNLNTYVGAVLGQTGYIRYRDLEFSLKDVPRNELLAKIDEVIAVVENTLDKVSEAQLQEEFPILIFDEKKSVLFTLVHLTTHLAYHLGQVNYHRRLLAHT
ncbi:MAG: DinB family protein [Cytophagales bacterium]|nr:MAG: DinB family protein [Cytophagales bacterium]